MDGAKLKKYRGTYCAVWRAEGATRRASLRTSDIDEARRRFVDWQAAGKRRGETVSEIVDAYLLDKATKASSAVMKWSWKPLKPVFGHLRPEQVDRAVCRAYATQRRRHKRSESTIVRELSLLRAALRWHDKATPALVEVPPAPPPRTYYLTRAEWAKFRQAALVTPHIHLFCVLAYRARRYAPVFGLPAGHLCQRRAIHPAILQRPYRAGWCPRSSLAGFRDQGRQERPGWIWLEGPAASQSPGTMEDRQRVLYGPFLAESVLTNGGAEDGAQIPFGMTRPRAANRGASRGPYRRQRPIEL